MATDKKSALAEISDKVKEAYRIINECEAIAKKHQVEFSFNVAYGMGGTFGPEWDDSGCSDEGMTYEWRSSSSSC